MTATEDTKAISGLTKCTMNARLWHLNRKFQCSASISDFFKIIPRVTSRANPGKSALMQHFLELM